MNNLYDFILYKEMGIKEVIDSREQEDYLNNHWLWRSRKRRQHRVTPFSLYDI